MWATENQWNNETVFNDYDLKKKKKKVQSYNENPHRTTTILTMNGNSMGGLVWVQLLDWNAWEDTSHKETNCALRIRFDIQITTAHFMVGLVWEKRGLVQ